MNAGCRCRRDATGAFDMSVCEVHAARRIIVIDEGPSPRAGVGVVPILKPAAPSDPMDNLRECGHPHVNHRPNDGACKVFVVRKGESCWCTGFEPKGGRQP